MQQQRHEIILDGRKYLPVKDAADMYVRKTAVEKVNDKEVLYEVIKNDQIDFVRNAAVERLNALQA